MLGFGLRSRKERSAMRFAGGAGLAVFASLYLALPVSIAEAQTADTVLFNGKILTVDKDFSVNRRWRSATARCWRQAHRRQ